MAARFAPIAGIQQTPNGDFIKATDHEEVIQQILETAKVYFKKIELGEITASEAMNAITVFAKLMG